MKFTNGFWLKRKGVELYSPAEIRDLETGDGGLTVYAPHVKVHHRGQTLGGPLLTIHLSAPRPDVIRVTAWHYKGGLDRGPAFDIHELPGHLGSIAEDVDTVTLQSGDLTAVLTRDAWDMRFAYQGRYLTGSGPRQMAYVTTEGDGPFMREQLSLGVGECVYGFGERFTPFVKNGQVVDIWNEDGGTCSEQAYKNIPFYLTNRGYGVFVNHPEQVSFEAASEVVSKVQFSVPGEKLDYFIIGGDTLLKVLENYTALTGRPALPPAWSFGLWLTTSFTTNYDEETVNRFIDGMAVREIPLHVFHFDCFWMKEFQWCDFIWDPEVFPAVRPMLARLKEKGLKVCVWINPYIGQKSKLFEEGMQKGYLLRRPDGSVWQWDLWQPGMGLADFTNPETCRWYRDHLAVLLDMGVDCFKTDFGERIPTDVRYFDGSDPMKMHNYYTHLYNKLVFDLLVERRGCGEAVLFARSATAGGQQFPVHWGGDCVSKYESMAESLRGGLSLCLSGFGYWSHDIGGFEQTASADVYKRWVAFGLLSSHSRLHGSSSYRVPWLFDEEAVEVLRFFTRLKCALMPYLYGIAVLASQMGHPMMRAMILQYPLDPACDTLDRQYMLGDALLAAPIFKEDGRVSYYLPEGTWTNLLTGETKAGSCWHQEQHGYLSLPLMVPPNTILPMGADRERPDYDYAQEMELHLFELADGTEAVRNVFDTDGNIAAAVTARRSGAQVSVQVRGDKKPFSVCLRNRFSIESVIGGSWQAGTQGAVITPDPGGDQLILYL